MGALKNTTERLGGSGKAKDASASKASKAPKTVKKQVKAEKKVAKVARKEVKATRPREVYVKKHHAKSYRKRHYTVLLASLAGVVVLLGVLLWYRDAVMLGLASSREFVSTLFVVNEEEKTEPITVTSSHGVSLTFDQKEYYGSAVSASDGSLYVGTELAKVQPYTSIRVAPAWSEDITGQVVNSTITLNIHKDYVEQASVSHSEVALTDAGIASNTLRFGELSHKIYGGVSFERTYWEAQGAEGIVASLKPQYSAYTALLENNTLITIVIAHGVTDAETDTRFDAVLSSLKFNAKVSAVPANTQNSSKPVAPLHPSYASDLLDLATNTQKTYAATSKTEVSASESIGALYSPAVVKIYNAYCMDISLQGVPFAKDVCSASSGTGFIVNGEGYAGTNGHVATADPKDIAIYGALSQWYYKSDSTHVSRLIAVSDLRKSDIEGKSTKDGMSALINGLYDISDSKFTTTRDVQNLLVNVTSTPPDVSKLVEYTKAARKYPSDEDVVRAKVVDSDFRYAEVLTGNLTASDVALIKLESGSNYPTVRLGSISDVSQGAGLSILGYPGQASANGIVSADSTVSTLTTGKVSSIKDASGGDKKLIETDTTIGHGNSGGPALTDSGMVVGVATYTSDGSGKGNGTYNYVRDIADFKELLTKNNVSASISKTQTSWETGMEKYFNSHYSSSLKYFEEVQDLYPSHTKAAEFIASAERHIENGDDVSEFPVWIVWVSLGILAAGSVLSVILIVRHKKKHTVYKAGVAQGVVQPTGDTRQLVTVTPTPPVVAAPSSQTGPVAPANTAAPVAPSPVTQLAPAPAVPATLAAPLNPVASVTPPVPVSPVAPPVQSIPVVSPPANPEAPVDPTTPVSPAEPMATSWNPFASTDDQNGQQPPQV